jgi:hypothetical protein
MPLNVLVHGICDAFPPEIDGRYVEGLRKAGLPAA